MSAHLNTKINFMYPVIIYHPFKYFWYLLVLYVKWPAKPPDLAQNDAFFYLSLFWQPFSVTKATFKV